MGEQPIYSTKAHVFQIDPKTKKNWIPASASAINVSYYYDSSRNTYRIISVEGSKAIINSTISANMTFTKTAQKFGQWADPRANTVYGLGFNSEAELAKFVEKFREVKDLIRGSGPDTNGSVSDDPHSPISPQVATPVRNIHSRTGSMSSVGSDGSNQDRRISTTNSIPIADSQLKYENDRLKIALAQSSANAKKWELELQTLKNNNARLTTALQESTTNVEEWKKQLTAYKEESTRLKKKVVEAEQASGSNNTKELEQRVNELSQKLRVVEEDKQKAARESENLTAKVQELSLKENQSMQNSDKIKELEKVNSQLKTRLQDLELEKESLESRVSRDTDDMLDVQREIHNKVSELGDLQDRMSNLLKSAADNGFVENSAL